MSTEARLPRPSSSLYVGDLAPEVNEEVLYNHFKVIGPIPSVRVLRDSVTSASLGYAYVNFTNPADAEKALNELNYSNIRGKTCRIMYVNRDPSLRKSGLGNIIIRNLPKELDYRGVTEMCTQYGPILSCRIMYDVQGSSKGCAFVHFANESSANEAVDKLNNMSIRPENAKEEAKVLKVEHYKPQQVLQQRTLDTFTNLYVKHLSPEVTDEKLKAEFEKFGETLSIRIMRGDNDVSRGFGFCSFKDHTSAVAAIEKLHDKPHEIAAEGRNMYVQRAMKRAERQKYVRQQLRERRSQYAQYTNLYVKNLDDDVTTDKLQAVFSQFGEIRSARVMKDEITGLSKGFGFVSFTNAEDAKRAVKELANRLILSSKPLFVTFAQRKEERRRQFELRQRQRYQQTMDPGFVAGPSAAPHYAPPGGMPGAMYPFGQPGFQAGPAMPRQPMMQPLHPTTSTTRPMPPMMAGRMPGGQPQPHQGLPRQTVPQMPMMMRQPAMPLRPMMGQQGPMPGAARPAPSAPKLGGGPPIDPSMLASMPPDQARNVLGERLYQRITVMHPDQAPKITGMLLEMDNSEILNLLDSADLLRQKVEEAVEVLRTHNR